MICIIHYYIFKIHLVYFCVFSPPHPPPFQAYKAVTGRYTDKKELLRLPPYVLSQRCIRDLDIQMDWGGFRVTARPAEEFMEDGHTRTDRFVWFGDKKEDFF